jgi:hypothetical protein
MTFAKNSVSYRWMQCASSRQLEPRSIAQIHPADPLSLTAALQGVHPVSLDFVADPAELAVAVVQGEVLEAAQHHREVLLLLASLPMSCVQAITRRRERGTFCNSYSRSLIPASWTDWNAEQATRAPADDAGGAYDLGRLGDLLHLRKIIDALYDRPVESVQCKESSDATEPGLSRPPRSSTESFSSSPQVHGFRRLLLGLKGTMSEPELHVLRARLNGGIRIGALNEIDLALPRSRPATIRTDEDTIALVRRLAVHYPDNVIAGILNRQGRTTVYGHRFEAGRLGNLRRHWDIPCFEAGPPSTKGELSRRPRSCSASPLRLCTAGSTTASFRASS